MVLSSNFFTDSFTIILPIFLYA